MACAVPCRAEELHPRRTALHRRNDGSGAITAKRRNRRTDELSFRCFVYSCAVLCCAVLCCILGIGETRRTPRPTRQGSDFFSIACRGKQNNTPLHSTPLHSIPLPGCGSATISAQRRTNFIASHCIVPSNATIVLHRRTQRNATQPSLSCCNLPPVLSIPFVPFGSIPFGSIRFDSIPQRKIRSLQRISKPNNLVVLWVPKTKRKETTLTIGERTVLEAERRDGAVYYASSGETERISIRWFRSERMYCDLRVCDGMVCDGMYYATNPPNAKRSEAKPATRFLLFSFEQTNPSSILLLAIDPTAIVVVVVVVDVVVVVVVASSKFAVTRTCFSCNTKRGSSCSLCSSPREQ